MRFAKVGLKVAYDIKLADRVREYLAEMPDLEIEEKEMFSGLNFMVNGKTCVCVSGENLMLRFGPTLQEEIAEKNGYQTMLMKGKEYKGTAHTREPLYASYLLIW